MNQDNSKKTRIVVVGAGYAGLLATIRLAGKVDEGAAEITLVNDSEQFVERIRLHQTVSVQQPRRLQIRDLLRGKSVRFVEGHATVIDRGERVLHVNNQDGTLHIGYDYLLYALGSGSQNTSIPGLAKYAYSIGRPAESASLEEELAESPAGAKIVVIGGGLTGIETSTEIAERYPQLKVSLWTEGKLGPKLSGRGRDYIEGTLSNFGIEIHQDQRVSAVQRGNIVVNDGQEISYDTCIWAGSFAVPSLAREAGLSVNNLGQALVDPFLRSVSDSRIYVAGDSAGFVDDPGARIRMACATALPMGAQAADNLAAVIADQPQKPFSFAYVLQCISLGRRKGLVQLVYLNDEPKERIITGRMAAFIKEFICRATVLTLKLERLIPGAYSWRGRGKAGTAEASVIPQM